MSLVSSFSFGFGGDDRVQDGTQVQLKSVALQKYVSAADGGGGNVTIDRDVASSWETFKVLSVLELV